nr:glutamate racemase [FCB group bacterium]
DSARVPYGTKSAPVVKQFSLQNSLFLLKHNVKLIVVACNSASALALQFLQERLSIPVIGVIEPGVKALMKESAGDPVGVIGTRATISSGAYQNAIKKYDENRKIFVQPCPLFVPLIEEGMTNGEIPIKIAEYYLNSMKLERIGALLLGCTHYPLMREVIAQVMGEAVTVVDSAGTTAESVKEELKQRGWLKSQGFPSLDFYASDVSSEIERRSRAFFGGELPVVKKVEFEVADFWV